MPQRHPQNAITWRTCQARRLADELADLADALPTRRQAQKTRTQAHHIRRAANAIDANLGTEDERPRQPPTLAP